MTARLPSIGEFSFQLVFEMQVFFEIEEDLIMSRITISILTPILAAAFVPSVASAQFYTPPPVQQSQGHFPGGAGLDLGLRNGGFNPAVGAGLGPIGAGVGTGFGTQGIGAGANAGVGPLGASLDGGLGRNGVGVRSSAGIGNTATGLVSAAMRDFLVLAAVQASVLGTADRALARALPSVLWAHWKLALIAIAIQAHSKRRRM